MDIVQISRISDYTTIVENKVFDSSTQFTVLMLKLIMNVLLLLLLRIQKAKAGKLNLEN